MSTTLKLLLPRSMTRALLFISLISVLPSLALADNQVIPLPHSIQKVESFLTEIAPDGKIVSSILVPTSTDVTVTYLNSSFFSFFSTTGSEFPNASDTAFMGIVCQIDEKNLFPATLRYTEFTKPFVKDAESPRYFQCPMGAGLVVFVNYLSSNDPSSTLGVLNYTQFTTSSLSSLDELPATGSDTYYITILLAIIALIAFLDLISRRTARYTH